jgi:hypothetical protein
MSMTLRLTMLTTLALTVLHVSPWSVKTASASNRLVIKLQTVISAPHAIERENAQEISATTFGMFAPLALNA